MGAAVRDRAILGRPGVQIRALQAPHPAPPTKRSLEDALN